MGIEPTSEAWEARSKNQALELAALSKFGEASNKNPLTSPNAARGSSNQLGWAATTVTVEQEQSGCFGIAMESARRRLRCRRKCRRFKAAYGTEKHARLVTL